MRKLVCASVGEQTDRLMDRYIKIGRYIVAPALAFTRNLVFGARGPASKQVHGANKQGLRPRLRLPAFPGFEPRVRVLAPLWSSTLFPLQRRLQWTGLLDADGGGLEIGELQRRESAVGCCSGSRLSDTSMARRRLPGFHVSARTGSVGRAWKRQRD